MKNRGETYHEHTIPNSTAGGVSLIALCGTMVGTTKEISELEERIIHAVKFSFADVRVYLWNIKNYLIKHVRKRNI